MDEYREMVRRLARERTGEPFFNASPDHAAVIVENMFRTAQREVCVFTSHLAPRVYAREESVKWAEIFLSDDEKHSFRVLLKEGDMHLLKTNPLFNATKSAKNAEFRALRDEFHDRVAFSMMVVDSDSYRFEPDKHKCEAVAAFNSKGAKKLDHMFETLWPMGKSINLDNLEAFPLNVRN